MMRLNTQQKADLKARIEILGSFIGYVQLSVMQQGIKSEEGQFFYDKIIEYSNRVNGMPHTYQQDGKGKEALAYLHYFNGSSDWYILEKDISGDEPEGHVQAFGFVCLNGDTDSAELGYISIPELLNSQIELDLHWDLKTLGEIQEKLSRTTA